MKRGTVLFSNNEHLICEHEYRPIAAKLKTFADVQTLKILTADGSYASIAQIAAYSETSSELVAERLTGTLMPYVEERVDDGDRMFCIQGQSRNILPILSLLQP